MANMVHATSLTCLLLAWCLALAEALPTSVVEEVKSNDISNKKVKRAQAPIVAIDERPIKESAGYFSPTPIKRGINLKTDQLPLLTEWDQQRYRQSDNMPSPLYTPEEELDDKSLAEYEKGYRYGTSKDKLDEALENAILKSELYGDPAAVNQYRYFGNDDRRRRRRNVQKMRISNRFKRQSDLSPEDILAILTLWENERERAPSSYRSWQRFDPGYDADLEHEDSDAERNDEDWMDQPVYPHITDHLSPMSPSYYYDAKPVQREQQVFEKRSGGGGHWGGFSPDASASKKKRFMVAKKRGDPTREIRFLNGPTRNDFYTLSELLGSQREPTLPTYQRYML